MTNHALSIKQQMRMALSKFFSSATFVWFSFLLFAVCSLAVEVSHDSRAIIIDGQRRVLISGSIHYPRSTPEMWPDLIKKSKQGGLDAIETYVFWNAHEPARRQYDFTENLDLIRFLKAIQDEGLYAILRIGPYVCAEWNYGGFPVWLHNMPGVELRTYNDVFMNEMQNFTQLIVDMVKKENLFASQGGPIILAQIENEYGNVMSGYGDAGKLYINWCASMANSLDIGVPWIMCQQKDAPEPMLETCNGWYCDQYTPSNPNTPKIWTENWTGWFKSWGGADPLRTAEDLAFSVARFFQTGGTLQNYYMYHGGTNFGRTAGGPYISTTYDYDAPLDEYGNLNQPKWGHLKQLHDVLHFMEYVLTHGNISEVDLGKNVTATLYATENVTGCFLANTNPTNDATVNFQGSTYNVPAWSVSVLPDCKTVAYSTAKVSTQTTVLVNKPSLAENEPATLGWSWRPEDVDKFVLFGKGHFQAYRLLDQKEAANDASDYLWYMTKLYLHEDDPIFGDEMILRVNGTGHVLHVYVNGEYLDTEFAKYDVLNYVFEKKVELHPGHNQITLLSATLGMKNYGQHFDLIPAGIPGPVEIVTNKGSDEKVIKSLSGHKWTYHVGLHGLSNHLYSSDSKSVSKWTQENLPTDRKLTWYKTTFKAPLGSKPVVLDLQGMGKGHAWVNGNSLGRYWPSFIAEGECSNEVCDYRGSYSNNKCVSKCGEPTQRYYHVPRSFLTNGTNTLVLFEEFGGNPSSVNFQTVEVGSVCAKVEEGTIVELSCDDKPIMAVQFASFGDPNGECGSFSKGSCEASTDPLDAISKACVGKDKCTIHVSEGTFGTTSCDGNISKTLAVEAVC